MTCGWTSTIAHTFSRSWGKLFTVWKQMFFSLMKPGLQDANKIYSFLQLYTLCLPVITYLRKRGNQVVLEVLLTLPFGIHGIENRLSLRLIPFPQLINLSLHLCVQASHSLLQLLVGEKLQLRKMIFLCIQIFFLYGLL